MMYYRATHLLVPQSQVRKRFNYKDFIPLFKAEKFDADEWIRFFKDNHVKFIMPVGEHHDGLKMYSAN